MQSPASYTEYTFHIVLIIDLFFKKKQILSFNAHVEKDWVFCFNVFFRKLQFIYSANSHKYKLYITTLSHKVQVDKLSVCINLRQNP